MTKETKEDRRAREAAEHMEVYGEPMRPSPEAEEDFDDEVSAAVHASATVPDTELVLRGNNPIVLGVDKDGRVFEASVDKHSGRLILKQTGRSVMWIDARQWARLVSEIEVRSVSKGRRLAMAYQRAVYEVGEDAVVFWDMVAKFAGFSSPDEE